MKKRRKKTKPTRFPYFLISLGLILITFWSIHRVFSIRSLRLSASILASYASQTPPDTIPVFLSTRGIKNLAITESDGRLITPHAGNHVRNSAAPGTSGNIILYGHNTKNVLGPIRWLSVGDTITVTTANGKEYLYRVYTKKEVHPTQTELLSPTTVEVLTLYTCSGLFDSKRFVVRAIPI